MNENLTTNLNVRMRPADWAALKRVSELLAFARPDDTINNAVAVRYALFAAAQKLEREAAAVVAEGDGK